MNYQLNYQAIYDDLQLPQFASMTNAEFVAARNAKTLQRQVIIKKQKANNYAIGNLDISMSKVISMPYDENTIDKPIPEAGGVTVRLAAQTGLNFLMADTGPTIDPNVPKTQTLIGLLLSAGVFTQQQVDGFWGLFKEEYSEAEELYGGDLTESDVATARVWNVTSHMANLQNAVAVSSNELMDYLAAARTASLEGAPLPTAQAVIAKFDELFTAQVNT